MKKTISIILSMSLALAMFFIMPISVSKAFTVTKRITLMAGESYKVEQTVEGNTFKAAKSSKKSIAVVKRTDDLVTITAKKKGKATITIKTKNKTTYKYVVSVKKKDIRWTASTPHNVLDETTNRYNSSIMFEIVNKTGIYASAAKVEYIVYGTSGKELFKGSQEIKEFLPEAKIHVFASSLDLLEKIKSAKITKITPLNREHTINYKYLNKSSSMDITEVSKDDYSITLKLNNKLSESITGVADVVFYADDAAKQPIGMNPINLYTNSGSTNTLSVAPIKGYKTYKIFKRAYVVRY